ncbi:MAG: type II secretion system protein [Oscillospiraceae bacterium]|nr:type II secretion system protein [Oscillospiraceae bacterium]
MTKFEKRRSGFTLIETMVVVAIVTILAAITAAGVTGYASSLTHLERMNNAKAIYIAAQNRLVNLKTLNKFAIFQEEALSQHYQTKDDEDGSLPVEGMVYVDESTAAVIDELLPEGAISSEIRDGGHYYIDFDPINGYVYDVFYSEHNFTYSSVSAIRGNKDALKHAEVGYYGQSTRANINGAVVKLSPAFSLTNGEELYLTAKYTSYFVSTTASANWTLYITMQGLSSGETHTFETVPADIELDGNTVTVEYVIDSLKPGESFYEKFGASGYEPGEKLNIMAQMTYTGSVVTATPSDNRSVGAANSLYDNVIGADVRISCGRHLQNLSKAVSHVTYAGTLPVDAVTTVTFLSDIDWENGTLHYYHDKYHTSADVTFEPLENIDFFGTTGVASGVTIAGAKHIVSNVDISGGTASSCAGFFPVLNLGSGRATNLFLKNLTVSAGDAQYIGGFAGYLISGTVTGCGIYGDASYEDVLIRSTATAATNPAGLVGGFVGKNGGTIRESFAAGTVDAKASSAGGFSGENGGLIECCYANCYTYAWKQAAGFSAANRGRIYGSFSLICAESDSAASGTSAGFALVNTGGIISGCYSAMDDVDYGGSAYELTYPFAPVGVGSMTNCYFYYSGLYNTGGQAGTRLYTSEMLGAATRLGYNDGTMNKNPWRTTQPTTKKYNHIEVGAEKYIYPTSFDTIFYGDWPADSTLRLNGVYPTKVVDHLLELNQDPYNTYYVELPYYPNGKRVYDANGNPSTVKYWLVNADEKEDFTVIVNDNPSLYRISWLSTAGAIERTGDTTSKLYTGDDTGLYTISATERNSGSMATAYVLVYTIKIAIEPEALHMYYADRTSSDIDLKLTVEPEALRTINWMPLEKYIDGDVDWDIDPYKSGGNPVVSNGGSDNESITVNLIPSGSIYRFGTSYVTATFTDTVRHQEHELVCTVTSLPSGTAGAYLEFDQNSQVSGFFIANSDGNYIDNISTNNRNDITAWYYGVLSPKTNLSFSDTATRQWVDIKLTDGSVVGYWFYRFTDAGTGVGSSKKANRTVTADGTTYTYHMLFAGSVKQGGGTISTTNNTFQIRASDQLQNINYENSYLNGNNTYNQTHNIKIASGFEPIGRGGAGTVAFCGIYDGHGYTLEDYSNIDYPNKRFIGLIGQLGEMTVNNESGSNATVSNEKPGTLRNVVMLATNPGTTGKIIATYNPTSDKADTSVGTLVGLIYTPNSSVENCVVCGYTIDYTNNASSSSALYSHVGGLVGINMGTVKNCCVISNTLTASTTNSNTKTYISGLVGANFGLVESCYAGGDLYYGNTTQNTGTISGLAGFSGGTWGNRPHHPYGVKTVKNSYSICRIQPTTATVYPVTPTRCTYGSNNYTDTVTNCYYLTATVSATVAGSYSGGTGLAYKVMDGSQLYNGATFTATLNAGISSANRKFSNATAAHTYPYSGKLTSRPYPFPAIVQNTIVDQGVTSTFYLHYGDWPLLTDYSISLIGEWIVAIGNTVEIVAQSNDEPMVVSQIQGIDFNPSIASIEFEGTRLQVTGVEEGETAVLVTAVGDDGLIYRASATITVIKPKVTISIAPVPCEILVDREDWPAYLTVAAPMGWSFDEETEPTLEIITEHEGDPICFEVVGWELQSDKYWIATLRGIAVASAQISVGSATIINDFNTEQVKETVSEDPPVTITVYDVPDGFTAAPADLYMDSGVSEDLLLTLPEDCENDSPVITFKVYDTSTDPDEELLEDDWPFTLNSSDWTVGTDGDGRTTYANGITSKEGAAGSYRIEISLEEYAFTFQGRTIEIEPSGPQSIALSVAPVTLSVSLDESKESQEREITLEDVTEKMYVMPVFAAKADSAILNATVATDNPNLAGAYLWTAENVTSATQVSLSGVTADAAAITLTNEVLAEPGLYRVTCTFTAKGRVYTDSYYVLVYRITVTPAVAPATLGFNTTGTTQAINLTASSTVTLSCGDIYSDISGTSAATWSSATTAAGGTATHTITYSDTYTDEFGGSWLGTATASGTSSYFVNAGTLSATTGAATTYTVTRTTSYVPKTIYVLVDGPLDGGTYIIVNRSAVGTGGYAMKANASSPQGAVAVTVVNPNTTNPYYNADGTQATISNSYIDPADLTGLRWNYKSGSNGYLQDVDDIRYYLYASGSNSSLALSQTPQQWTYTTGNYRLRRGTTGSVYVHFNSSGNRSYTATNSATSVYFYQAYTVYVAQP